MLETLHPVRVRLGRRIYGDFGKCVRVSGSRMLKRTIPAESDALLYVALNTNVQVPKVYRTYSYRGEHFVEMEFVRGQNLETVWFRLSAEEKDRVMRNLADYVKQLRELQPPENGGIGSVAMKETKDLRLSYLPFGPFHDVEAFHSFVRKNVPLEKCQEILGDDVFLCHARTYRTTMTHADLCFRNMILDRAGRLVIIDWEFAAWRPEYWEFTKFFYAMIAVSPEVEELFRKYFDNYSAELKTERHLWKILDVPGAD